MTHRRRVVVLVSANALLAAALVVGAIAGREHEPLDEPLIVGELPDVGRVSFETPGFALERTVAGWDVVVDARAYPAREDRVDELVDELGRARIVRRVTDDPRLHDEFGVDEARGRTLAVEHDGGESRLVFGDEVPGAIYLRRSGRETVWLARTALDFHLDRGAVYYAFLRLFPESARPQEVVRLSVVTAADDYELVRRPGENGERWGIVAASTRLEVAGGTADEEVAASLARTVVDLVGSGFYGGDAWVSLPVVARVSFDLADGRSFAVEIRDEGGFLVARPRGPALPGEAYEGLTYTLDPATVRRVAPSFESVSGGA